MPEVSVIVPAYNAADFLRECVGSVLAQTCPDFELIIVDDGSADGTGEIADELAEIDSRISVLHKPNGGLSTARNAGLDMAKGDYIAFVDADDEIHPEFLRTALDAIAGTGADIFSCAMLNAKECRWASIDRGLEIMTAAQAIERVLYQRGGMHCSACAHLYKAEIWRSERFTEGRLYEDLDAFYRVYGHAAVICYTGAPLYFYRINPKSIIHTFRQERLDVLDVTDRIVRHFSSDPILMKAAKDRRFAANFNMLGLCSAHGHSAWRQCWRRIKADRREVLLNSKSRLKNRLGALLSYLGPSITKMITSIAYRKQ